MQMTPTKIFNKTAPQEYAVTVVGLAVFFGILGYFVYSVL